jgi:hypothetical protein
MMKLSTPYGIPGNSSERKKPLYQPLCGPLRLPVELFFDEIDRVIDILPVLNARS